MNPETQNPTSSRKAQTPSCVTGIRWATTMAGVIILLCMACGCLTDMGTWGRRGVATDEGSNVAPKEGKPTVLPTEGKKLDDLFAEIEFPSPPPKEVKPLVLVYSFKGVRSAGEQGARAVEDQSENLEISAIGDELLRNLLTQADWFSLVEVLDISASDRTQHAPAGAYQLKGMITHFSIRTRIEQNKWSSVLDIIKNESGQPAIDWHNNKTKLMVECAVSLRLLKPMEENADLYRNLATGFGQVKREDTTKNLGLDVSGIQGVSSKSSRDVSVTVDRQTQGKILRVAIAQAIKDLLANHAKRASPATDSKKQ